MTPTFLPGDVIYVESIQKISHIERGDIVCFIPPLNEPETAYFAMRVVGLPHEQIEMEDGGLVVNGILFDAAALMMPELEFSPDDHPLLRQVQQPFTLGDGQYFVLGDNVAVSYDSRYWGAVNESMIIGRVNRIKRDGHILKIPTSEG